MLKRFINHLAIVIVFVSVTACSDPAPNLTPLAANATILAFGDSLTYGTGANSETESYPAILQQLTQRTVVNAGIPGEISKEGLARLPAVLAEVNPDLVILCHGGNDIIRRLDKTQLTSNLEQMIQLIQNSGAEVVLIGVPKLGLGLTMPDLYPELADKYQLANDMDLLVELEGEPSLKSDPIHPNAEGYRVFGQRVFNLLLERKAIN